MKSGRLLQSLKKPVVNCVGTFQINQIPMLKHFLKSVFTLGNISYHSSPFAENSQQNPNNAEI